MELTLSIDLAHTSATLVEKHSLVAGDVYNPLYADFGNLTDAQVAAIDTGSLVLTVRRGSPSGDIVASSNMFSSASRTASNGTTTPCPKMRQTTLLLNGQTVKDWFDEEVAAGSDMSKTVYVELSDANVTYVACQLPIILRSFTVGGTNPGYYTKEEVDDLLAEKLGIITASLPLSLLNGVLSVRSATTSTAGVVKVGARLSVSPDGTLAANDQTVQVDGEFDEESANPVKNSVIAAAISALSERIEGFTTSLEGLTNTVSGKQDSGTLAAVATSGSYNDLSDKPDLPGTDAIGNRWYSGTGVTGTSTMPTRFPSSGVESANVGDMYLNRETSAVYRCVAAGSQSVATWSFQTSLRGEPGTAGTSGQIKATYPSLAALNAGWSTDGLAVGELAILDTGSVVDPDNGKLYRKGLSGYEFLCDLSGTPGARWHVGTAVSGQETSAVFPQSGIVANTGDMYLNSSTGHYYACVSGGAAAVASWSYVGTLKGGKGDAGDPGRDGLTWYSGTGVTGSSTNPTTFSGSQVESARTGDKYLNTSTGAVYECVAPGGPSSATWRHVINLKGAQGDPGAPGTVWHFGTEVAGDTSSVSIASGSPSVGDFYLNTATGTVYRCTSVSGDSPTWNAIGVMKGTDGTDGSAGSVWHHGTSVHGTSSMQATVTDGLPLSPGDYHFNTDTHEVHYCASVLNGTGTWTYLCTITSDGVTTNTSHTAGYIPVWEVGDSLAAGYEFIASSAVRTRGTASQTAVPSEYSVALALEGKVTAPSQHSPGTIPVWGDSSTSVLLSELSVRTTALGGVRVAAYAADSAVPTEKAVRAAIDVVADALDSLRLDGLAAPQAGSTRLDATQSVHGLLSAIDKKKIDGLVDHSSAQDIGESLSDNDTVPVFNASENHAARIMSALRVWEYMKTKLPAYRLDGLGVPDDTTDLDVSADRHGLCPKLPSADGSRKVLAGNGQWVLNEAANTFTGDSGSGGSRGQVPAPAAGDGAAAKFLCADGTWTVVPGGQQYTDWEFSDGGAWVLAWDAASGNWTATDGENSGTMSGQYDRTATTVVFTSSGQTVTATRSVTSNVSIHSLNSIPVFDGLDEILVHDQSAGSQAKASIAALAAFVQSFDRYDTLFVPAGAMTPGESNGASPVEIYVAGNGTTHDAMRFPYSGSVDTCVDFNVVFPDDWDLGDVKAKMVWRLNAVNTATTETNVKFGVCARAYGDTEDYSSALGDEVYVTDTLHGLAETHVTGASPAISVGGTPGPGKMVHFKITRTFSSVADSLAADVNLLGVLFQFRRSGVQVAW